MSLDLNIAFHNLRDEHPNGTEALRDIYPDLYPVWDELDRLQHLADNSVPKEEHKAEEDSNERLKEAVEDLRDRMQHWVASHGNDINDNVMSEINDAAEYAQQALDREE